MDGLDLLTSGGNSRDGVVDISSGGGGLWNLEIKPFVSDDRVSVLFPGV